YVSTSTTLGGAEKTLYLLATSFDQLQIKTVEVIGVKPNAEYAKQLSRDNYPVSSLDVKSIFDLRSACDKLKKKIQETKPDIVHAIMYQAIQLCRMVKRSYGGFKLISS